MPATLEKPREVIQFRALASAGHVDAEKGIIKGASVLTVGPALGHGITVDEKSLQQCLEACQELGEEGVKLVIDHESGFQEIVGAVQNFRVKGLQLLGDIHLLESIPDTRAHILELAQKLPRNIGLSVETYGEPEKLDGKKHFRVTSIDAIALVPNPAANVNGLFSRRRSAQIVTKLSELSIEELRQKIQEAASEDSRFNRTPDGNAYPIGVWVADLLTENDQWSAILQANDGKYYRVDVTVTSAAVALNNPKEVERTVEYKPVTLARVDNNKGTNLESMDANELKTLFADALKPVTDQLDELKKKVDGADVTQLSTKLDEQKSQLGALPTEEKIRAIIDEQLKAKSDEISANAVTRFAATVGIKKAPDGSLEQPGSGKTSFSAKIKAQQAAGAPSRAVAIVRAANDDPQGFDEWEKAGRPMDS